MSRPTLDSDATFDPENFSYPHGTHLCATEVDTETGAVKIRSYVCVDDIGEVVNPLIVEGQVHGGLAQGIAQALYEEAIHDDQGTLTTATFVDYLVPGAPDLPHFTTDRTTTALDHEPVGGQGSRRGGHHRLDAGGGQLRARRGAPPRGQGHRHAAVAAAGVAGGADRRRRPSPARARPPRRGAHWPEDVQSGGVGSGGPRHRRPDVDVAGRRADPDGATTGSGTEGSQA